MSEANAASGITTSITAAPPRIATTSRWASPANASTAPPPLRRLLEQARGHRGGVPRRLVPFRRPGGDGRRGLHRGGGPIKDVINTGGVLVASREVEDAIYHDARVAEVAGIGTPD